MTPDQMRRLAVDLGEAKNRQNVEDALKFMHDDIVLESPAWGLVARGKDENRNALNRFFTDYPDYNVTFDHGLIASEVFSCDLMQVALQSGVQPDAVAKAVFPAAETAA